MWPSLKAMLSSIPIAAVGVAGSLMGQTRAEFELSVQQQMPESHAGNEELPELAQQDF